MGLGAVFFPATRQWTYQWQTYSISQQKHERNYGISELWATKHFHAYLYGHQCKVFTDHSALQVQIAGKAPLGLKDFACEPLGHMPILLRFCLQFRLDSHSCLHAPLCRMRQSPGTHSTDRCHRCNRSLRFQKIVNGLSYKQLMVSYQV